MGWRLILVRFPGQRCCQIGLASSQQFHRPLQSLQFQLLLAHHVIQRLNGVVLKGQPGLEIIHPLYKIIAAHRKPSPLRMLEVSTVCNRLMHSPTCSSV